MGQSLHPGISLTGGEKPRMLLNRVVVGRVCHTVLAPSEPSKASLAREMLCARAAGGGIQVLRVFSESREFTGLITGKGDNKVHKAAHG